jgi:hypothetical protein
MKRIALVFVVLFAAPALAAPQVQSVSTACKDVPEAENHLAVLLSQDDVLYVEEITARDHGADLSKPARDGARIVLAARPFVSAAWLQQAIGCHMARNAAFGPSQRDKSSPLDVPGAVIDVSSEPGKLFVDVTAVDPNAARQIVARARALVPVPTAP